MACRDTCFAAGTMVNTPDGEKSIETLKKGDLVYAYDTETQQVVTEPILETYIKQNNPAGFVVLEDGTSIHVTYEHIVYSVDDKKWVKIGSLHSGSQMLGINGQFVKIKSLDFKEAKPITTYNINVESRHNYYVHGVLVHNMSIYDPNACIDQP